MRKRIAAIIVLSFLLSGVSPVEAVIHDIIVGNNFFSPLGTSVQPGDTVRWIWVGHPLVPHNTISDFGSPKTWSSTTTNLAAFTFEEVFTLDDGPGPFPYRCTIHSFTMIDTIYVDAAGGCCVGSTGNIDNDINNVTDIADLTFLIDHLFISLLPLACPAEGNIDGDNAGVVDIADLTFLIDHLFISLIPTAVCQ